MQEWEPILCGEHAILAINILKEIETRILKELDNEPRLELAHGIAGQLIFLSEYDSNHDALQNEIEKFLDKISEQTSFTGGLMTGLSGLGFALKIINDKQHHMEHTFFDDIYHYVRRFAMTHIQPGDYDYMHGFLGECYFLLEEDNSTDNLELFQAAIKNLEKLSCKRSNGITWTNKLDARGFNPNVTDVSPLPEMYNLGLAHGMPGIIYILKCLSLRYPELMLSPMIDDALSFLISEEAKEDKRANGRYYKAYASPYGDIHKGLTLAWCYSDLGISMIYFKLSEISGNKELFDRAIKIASFCAVKRIEDTPVETSGLCHGAAGIAHLFNKIYNITKDPIFKTASVYWFDVLFKKFIIHQNGSSLIHSISKRHNGESYNVDNGFLDGLAGIGLSIHTAIGSRTPQWDRILLL